MSNLPENDQASYPGISMKSNAGSIELPHRSCMGEALPIPDVTNPAQRGLSSFNLNEHHQQAGTTWDRRTQDWVKTGSSSPLGRGNIMERRGVIKKQLRATNKLAGELAGTKSGEQQSGSVKGLKEKAECQDLRFVGGWVDEKDKQS